MRTRFTRVLFARQFACILTSAISALLLAGCGGGSSSSSPTSTGVTSVNLANGSNGLGGSTVNPSGDGTSGFKGIAYLTPTSSTSTTQTPLAGVVIQATLSDGTLVGKTVTSSSGNYSLPLIPGTFNLTAQNVSATVVPIAPPQQYTVVVKGFTTVNFAFYNKTSP